MRIGLIGIGQGGGKISDRLLRYDVNLGSNFIRDCMAVNTARQDLNGLEKIPEENRMLIGEAEFKGNGVGADNEEGKRIMQKEINEVVNRVDNMPFHEIDAFVVVASLGGGTGSGGMPVLCNEIKKRYTEPVYGIGVLPSSNEGDIYTVNTARALDSVADSTDNLLLFDNDAWSRGRGSLEEWYSELNDKIAVRFGSLFAAGEMGEDDQTAENVVDASEIMNTLDCGGISAIGYASSDIDEEKVNPGLLTRLTSGVEVDKSKSATRMRSLSEQAVSGSQTVPVNIKSTERALIVFSGPPKFIARKGMEEGRSTVERKTDCMEVRGGDYPKTDTPEVSCTVLLSGVYDIPRVKEIQKVAAEADERIQKARDERGQKFEELLQNEDAEEIDSLLEE